MRLLGRAPFQYGKQTWELDADRTSPRDLRFRWADVVAALTAQPSRFAPTVTVEHQRNGTGLGTVQRIVELTAAQARAKGIRQDETHALYAGLRLTDADARAAYDGGRVQWVSPAVLAALPTDEPGHVAPIWIDEISFVTVPHLRGQPNVADALRGVQLKAGENMNAHEKILAALADKLAAVGVDPAKAKEVVDAMTEHMGEEEYLEMQDAEKAEAESAEMASAECGTDEFAKTQAKMAAEIAELRATLAAQSASARVDLDTANRNVTPAGKAALAKLAATDEAAYTALLSSLPVRTPQHRPLPTARPAASGPAVVETPAVVTGAAFASLDEDGQHKAITALMSAKGIDYLEAAHWCVNGRMSNRLTGLVASGLVEIKG